VSCPGPTNSWGATGQRGGWPAPAAHFSWRTLRQTGNFEIKKASLLTLIQLRVRV